MAALPTPFYQYGMVYGTHYTPLIFSHYGSVESKYCSLELLRQNQ